MSRNDIIEKIKANIKIVIAITIIFLVGIFLLWKTSQKPIKSSLVTADNLITQSTTKEKATPKSEQTSSEKNDTIVVDIKGAVKKPAIYTVPNHARVNDVVALAGGLIEQADTKSINLAQKVTDEMVIYVASIGENVTASAGATGAGSATSAAPDKVNINTADITQLQTLSGVGDKRAQDIINYREANGNFKTIEELGKVSGIGEKTLEKLKERITVD